MNKRILAAIAVAVAAVSSIALSKPKADIDPPVWVVKDSDTTIYLFGTFHLLDGKSEWFNDEVKASFDASQELALEAILPENPASIQPLVAKYAIDPNGRKLSERLRPEMRVKLDKQIAKAGLPTGSLERFEPWFVATTLTTLGAQQLGLSGAQGPEAILTKAARATGKSIGELESVEKQLALLDSLSDEQQIAFLEETLDSSAKLKTEFPAMIKAWSKGDMRRLARMLNQGLDESPGLYKILLTDRNARWADWIVARMDRPGSVFLAVGAGHLAGKDSVLDLLKKRGFTPERVKL